MTSLKDKVWQISSLLNLDSWNLFKTRFLKEGWRFWSLKFQVRDVEEWDAISQTDWARYFAWITDCLRSIGNIAWQLAFAYLTAGSGNLIANHGGHYIEHIGNLGFSGLKNGSRSLLGQDRAGIMWLNEGRSQRTLFLTLLIKQGVSVESNQCIWIRFPQFDFSICEHMEGDAVVEQFVLKIVVANRFSVARGAGQKHHNFLTAGR